MSPLRVFLLLFLFVCRLGAATAAPVPPAGKPAPRQKLDAAVPWTANSKDEFIDPADPESDNPDNGWSYLAAAQGAPNSAARLLTRSTAGGRWGWGSEDPTGAVYAPGILAAGSAKPVPLDPMIGYEYRRLAGPVHLRLHLNGDPSRSSGLVFSVWINDTLVRSFTYLPSGAGYNPARPVVDQTRNLTLNLKTGDRIFFKESSPDGNGRGNAMTMDATFSGSRPTAPLVDNPADWPPVPDWAGKSPAVEGRTVERYTHGVRSGWGYRAPQRDRFYVVSPERPRRNAPLYVVLHSAGHSGDTALLSGFIKVNDHGDYDCTLYHAPPDCYGLYVDCRVNGDKDWWWGWDTWIKSRPRKYARKPNPTEARVLDTIEWAVRHYQIDRNRIYLAGLSMGGCGSLALGMPRGNLFAAICVWVPAGTNYFAYRLGIPPGPGNDAPANVRAAWPKPVPGLPDPPPLVDLSAQNDDWSRDQALLLSFARAHRLALVFGWGPFGHNQHSVDMAPYAANTLAYPWRNIVKNAAYPVFTDASSDQNPPWLSPPALADASGQMNAFFRWANIKDTPAALVMRLWLADPVPASGKPMPQESVVDITLRRLQAFRVVAGRRYTWDLRRAGKIVASGQITPDADGLLTIRRAVITVEPADLFLKPANAPAADHPKKRTADR